MKVLLVEDSLVVGKTMAAELAAYNYQILGPVATGEEALSLCRRQSPDIVLMDIELSGRMDGVEAARLLMSGQQIPVIYLTGHVDTAMLDEVINSGSSTYLLKPVRAAELHANIQMTLRLARAQASLQESEAKYRYLLDNIYDGYAYLKVLRDQDGKVYDFAATEVNDAFLRLFSVTRERCIHKKITQIFPEIKSLDVDVMTALADVVKLKKSLQLPEIHGASLGKWFSIQAACPQPETVAMVFADITDKKKAEENIRFLGFHDPLTALYNRSFFETELERLDQERLLPLSIIFADMNNLKYINDTYGHLRGDECLVRMAEALKEACRREDIVCRWGGDEFVILLPGTTNDVGNRICDRIRRRSRGCWALEEEIECPAISLGCATKGISEQSIKDVFKEAEARMYLDKAASAAINRGGEDGR